MRDTLTLPGEGLCPLHSPFSNRMGAQSHSDAWPHRHPRSFGTVLLRSTLALTLAHLVDFVFGVHAY